MSAEVEGTVCAEDNDLWRKEVQARVTGYRSRRGRRIEGAFSMRFPFPPEDVAEQTFDNARSEAFAEVQAELKQVNESGPGAIGRVEDVPEVVSTASEQVPAFEIDTPAFNEGRDDQSTLEIDRVTADLLRRARDRSERSSHFPSRRPRNRSIVRLTR